MKNGPICKGWAVCIVVGIIMCAVISGISVAVVYASKHAIKIEYLPEYGAKSVLTPAESIFINQQKLVRTADKPANFTMDPKLFEFFNYILPTEFIASGTSQLRSVEGYFQSRTIDGLRFTFQNASDD